VQVLEKFHEQGLSPHQTTPGTLARAGASVLLQIAPVSADDYLTAPAPPFIDLFRLSSFAYDVGILESLLASDSLTPAQREETAILARSLRLQDAEDVIPKHRAAGSTLALQVGQLFWKGEELGFVVGWASRPSKKMTGE
jgi:hypothetical protein